MMARYIVAITEDSCYSATTQVALDATTADEAIAEAEDAVREWLEDGSWDTSDGTCWPEASYEVFAVGEEEEPIDSGNVTITVHPTEPPCAGGGDHDWQSPYEVVGGIPENPGVCGSGGGVVIKEVCVRCGRYQITDTWATWRQELQESVKYREADDESLAWIAEQGGEEVAE